MSWKTVRPGMSVSSKNTDPYRGISALRYALFHSVGISHTLLQKPTRSVYEKLNVTFGIPLVSLPNRISIAGNYDFHKSR